MSSVETAAAGISLRDKILQGLLVLGGAALAVTALLADVVMPSSTRGFGLPQVTAFLLGVTLAAQAIPAFASETPLLVHWRSTARTLDRDAVLRFGVIALQVVLLALVVGQFQIENPAFYESVLPLAVFGFFVHHFLPMPQRLPFFVALSLSGVLLIFGVVQGLWLISLVLAVVGLCHLPVSFPLRIAALLAGAGVLALMRAGILPVPWSAGIWPVFASILMFRLIIYLYDLRHARTKPTAGWTLSYFFLLPNVVFPLFPVVDFSTFRRTYFDRDAIEIYQRGIQWMLRGLVHLLLYRVVYLYFTIAPEDINTTAELLRYILTTFLLYLKVSGLFHLIIGMLHLFGFRLPETHHLFYLASSFTDFWRRINIYWKDFMMKVVFYPTFLPLRRYGEKVALVTATLAVFAVTWFTHSYQWFWILGRWLLSWPDVIFWTTLGVLLVINSLRELRQGRSRSIDTPSWSPRRALSVGFKTAATFATIAVLWSLWNSLSLGDWIDILSVSPPTIAELGMVAGVLVLIGGLGALADWRGLSPGSAERVRPSERGNSLRMALMPTAGLAALYIVALPSVTPILGTRGHQLVRDLRVPELNPQDLALVERGYYEDLVRVSVQNSELWELYVERPRAGADIWQSGVLRETDSFLHMEMQPLVGIYQRGVSFRTNRWGMRDRDYAQVPEAGTYRIALLGQSYVAGDGVSDGQTFETLVEDRLNAEQVSSKTTRFEILNFAVGSYSVLQQLILLERAFTFDPDAVYFVASPNDADRAILHLVTQVRRGVEPPFPYLKELLESAEVDAALRETEAIRRLRPYRDTVLQWSLATMAQECLSRGVTPVWIYLYLPQEGGPGPEAVQSLVDMARSAGFATVDLSDVYAGRNLAELQVAGWDFHPNRVAHQIIADRVYEAILENEELGVPLNEERAQEARGSAPSR